MTKLKSLYVAASSQHVGKTTSTLGLASCFGQMGYKVGYCKPVGQQAVTVGINPVDKDTVLFADLIQFNIEPMLHSPVILGKGATSDFLEDPGRFNYKEQIMHASQVLEASHDLVIYEGTGHPGVGSVVNLSNAEVARMLGAGVVFIVEGGIGSAIDKLNMNLALFRESGVPILGIIANKVIAEKVDKIQHYLSIWLKQQNLPLLGVLPYDESLAYPLMFSVVDSIYGKVQYNPQKLDNQVEGFLAGSLIDSEKIQNGKNLLLVVSTPKVDEAVTTIKYLCNRFKLDGPPLAGIVATGQGDLSERVIDFVKEHQIPLVSTHFDTYGSVIKISRIEVKINLDTPWKIMRAIELINENVDLELLKQKLS
jgi:BioD-like phosphotransacetylase family protein